jgi:hypothetical protein
MRRHTFCLIGVFATALSAHAWADLKSPTYQQAKEAYGKKQWAKADNLLHRYLSEDHAFLAKNPDVAASIDKAAAFCDSRLQSESIASVSDVLDADEPASSPTPKASTPPPPLP